jgi:hypothetical protein
MNLFDYIESDKGLGSSIQRSSISTDSGSLQIETGDSAEQASHGVGSDSGRSSENGSIASDDVGSKSDDSDSDATSEDDEYDSNYENVKVGKPFNVVMYFGSEENQYFVGPASLQEMAVQIFECSGPSGRNRDYLFNLADSMRQISDEALDSHLSDLEAAVRLLEQAEATEKRKLPLL